MAGRDKGRRSAKGEAREPAAAGRAVTMLAVARLAGVSAMTVSRALKSDASVSKETRERVLEIVKRLDYVPDATARVFATRRSGFVAALVPSLNNSNFADTVRGMSEVFDGAGLQMLLGDTEYSLVREEDLIRALLQRRPEAIVLTGGVHTARVRKILANARIPVVETWDLPKQPLGDVVGFSNQAAGATMVGYLHDKGRRRIGFIGGETNGDTRGAERRAGFERATASLGLASNRIVATGKPPVSMAQGAEALDAMLRGWPDVDAIVCVSDLSAFGVLAECQRRGIDVPGRIALAGFGDFEVARCCHPRLTTIAVDCAGIGRRAAELALAGLDAAKRNAPRKPETTRIEFRVVARETA
jgi:LacI family transcriptional regulator, gluconate utilization system Gnt-I transcriptional repressor